MAPKVLEVELVFLGGAKKSVPLRLVQEGDNPHGHVRIGGR